MPWLLFVPAHLYPLKNVEHDTPASHTLQHPSGNGIVGAGVGEFVGGVGALLGAKVGASVGENVGAYDGAPVGA